MRLLRLLAAGIACVALFGCSEVPVEPTYVSDVRAVSDPSDITLTLTEAARALPIANDTTAGYRRDLFRHWVDADRDGCDARAEVLLAESTGTVAIGEGCRPIGGAWWSYYDDRPHTDASGLDIDHMVPLAEAWRSGAWSWTPGRRQAYANDLDDGRTLAAVTATLNRAKGDQDPARWMPPAPGARCRYLAEWIAVKLRWSLAVDPVEHLTLVDGAATCPPATLVLSLAALTPPEPPRPSPGPTTPNATAE